MARFFFFKGGALLEEASAFKKYFEPGPRPARVAINQRGFINQELTLGFRVLGLCLEFTVLGPRVLDFMIGPVGVHGGFGLWEGLSYPKDPSSPCLWYLVPIKAPKS